MTIIKRQMELHHAVSVIGGFWGGYTIFNHCDIFANAQTGNLIRLVMGLCTFQLESVAYTAAYFAIYFAANAFYAIARKKLKTSMKIISFIVSTIGIVLTGLLCFTGNSLLIVMPIFFIAPVQWNAFKSVGKNSSSTIFSSNNVRQAVILLTKYIMDRDKKDMRNARFYWATLLCFHIGVAISVLLTFVFGIYSIWFCLIFVGIAVGFYYRYQMAKANAFISK